MQRKFLSKELRGSRALSERNVICSLHHLRDDSKSLVSKFNSYFCCFRRYDAGGEDSHHRQNGGDMSARHIFGRSNVCTRKFTALDFGRAIRMSHIFVHWSNTHPQRCPLSHTLPLSHMYFFVEYCTIPLQFRVGRKVERAVSTRRRSELE